MVPTMGTVVIGGLGEWEAENEADQPRNVGDSAEARNLETAETGTSRQRKRRKRNAGEIENVNADSQKLDQEIQKIQQKIANGTLWNGSGRTGMAVQMARNDVRQLDQKRKRQSENEA